MIMAGVDIKCYYLLELVSDYEEELKIRPYEYAEF